MKFPQPTLLTSAIRGARLLTKAERSQLWLIALAHAAARSLDMIVLAAIVPLIMAMLNLNAATSGPGSDILEKLGIKLDSDGGFLLASLTVIALFGLTTIGSVVTQYAAARLASKCQVRQSGVLLRKISDAPLLWLLSARSAVLVRLVSNDVAIWARTYVEGGVSAIGAVTSILIGLALILWSTPLIGLATILVFGSLTGIVYRIVKIRVRYYANVHRESINQFAVTVDQLTKGFRDIRVSGVVDHFIRRGLFEAHRNGQSSAESSLWNAVGPASLMFFTQVSLLIFAYVMSLHVTNNEAITAKLALLVLVTIRLVPSLIRVGTSTTRIVQAVPYVEGIEQTTNAIDRAQQEVGRNKDGEPITSEWNRIAYHGVSLVYPGAKIPALNGINLTLRRGRSYGIVGPSGAGKSSLIDVLTGLVEPTKGTVTIDDLDLQTIDLSSFHNNLSYVAQSPFLLDTSISNNIAFGADPSAIDVTKVKYCISAVQLTDFVDQLPAGLDTRLGEQGALLSGGQRQRIAIARALYGDPSLLIFDEATSALDNVTESAIQSLLQELRERVTIVAIAHNISSVRHFDEIIVMNEGSILAHGTYDELLESSPLFAALANSHTAEAGFAADNSPLPKHPSKGDTK